MTKYERIGFDEALARGLVPTAHDERSALVVQRLVAWASGEVGTPGFCFSVVFDGILGADAFDLGVTDDTPRTNVVVILGLDQAIDLATEIIDCGLREGGLIRDRTITEIVARWQTRSER